MQMKKNKVEPCIFSTENEFKSLLQIHKEIKYIIAQRFPFLNQKIIDNLFVILSSHALLYDQIIRKGVNQQDSLIKQNSIGKLIQNNRNNFEKQILQHLTSSTTNFQTLLSQSKPDGFTIINTSINNKSESVDDSLRNEQESIITRIKRKMKIEKNTGHIRTNSVCLSPGVLKHEEQKRIKVENIINLKHIDNKQHDKTNNNIRVKPANNSVSNKKEKETKRKIRLEKNNPISNTQNNFEPFKKVAQTPVVNTQYLHTVSVVHETESRNNKDKMNNYTSSIVLNYKAGDIDIEKDIKSGVSKPSVNAKNLTKKYYDIVNTYEKLNSDEDAHKPSACNNISLHVSENPFTKRDQTIKQPKLMITLQNKLFSAENPSSNPDENSKKQGGKEKRASMSMKI